MQKKLIELQEEFNTDFKNGLSNDYLIDELTNYNMLSNSKDELISSAVVLWQPKNKLEQNK